MGDVVEHQFSGVARRTGTKPAPGVHVRPPGLEVLIHFLNAFFCVQNVHRDGVAVKRNLQ